MFGIFLIPGIIGFLYWITHVIAGNRTDKNKYIRRRVFGILVGAFFIYEVIFIALDYGRENPNRQSILIKRSVIGWVFASIWGFQKDGFFRAIYEPYKAPVIEGNKS